MPKYTTLTELAAAFRSGELDKTYFVIIDKGGYSLSLHQCLPGASDKEIDAAYNRCREIFKRPYGCPMAELLKLAGIPSEHA